MRPSLVTVLSLTGFVAALLIRVVPGGLQGAIDYDEGVYLSGAMALANGRFPWRDFVFLHPPGILLWLAPVTLAGPKVAFFAARALTACLGALNVVLVGRIVRGWAGVCAALFFATWWETVITDRGVFLEPLMNSAGLGALALVTLLAPSPRRTVFAGVLCAMAVAMKLWGGVWCLLVFIAAERGTRKLLVLSAVLTFALLVGPFLALAPADAWHELVRVHSLRPPDGDLERFPRLREMFVVRTLDVTVLLGLSLPFLVLGTRRRLGLGALLATLLVVASFLAAAAWWNQYDAALAPFVVLTLGVGLHGAFERLSGRGRLVLGAVVLALGARHLPKAWERPPRQDPVPAFRADTCAFSNAELIVAGRWPALVAPVLVDSYGQSLSDSAREGRFQTIGEAFSSEAAQVTLRRQLPQCRFVFTGWRGDWQLNAASKDWLAREFTVVEPGLFARNALTP